MTGDIHTQRNSADELLAGHLYTRINVLAIDLGQSYRQGARHGMHHCTFVHTVELGVVHLVGITQRSRRSAERHWSGKHTGHPTGRWTTLCRDQLLDPRTAAAEDTYPQRIQDEFAGRFNSIVRKIRKPGLGHVSCDRIDTVHS